MNHHQLWSKPSEQILQELQTALQGLSNNDAAERLSRYGANRIRPRKTSGTVSLLLNQ